MTGTPPDAVAVADLVVSRGGRTVLDGLDLTVRRGTVTGLLGPSGCGKSTLLRAIVGVQTVRTGTVTVLDRPAGDASLRRRVAYVTQAPSVYGDLTVRQNLDYYATVLGARREDVDQAIAQVDLTHRADARADQLSGGQRTRLSLATVLLGKPELMILDEPTVGLDPVLRRDLWDLFRRLVDDGATLLVSSHVMDEAERCDRLLLMRDGRILADETPAALKGRTGSPDVETAFLRLVESQTGTESEAGFGSRELVQR
jgi:ABC-2 type transport system ATP-binding protein